ncbi:MAG: YbaN family protein [Pseudomonadota bacterium]
MWHSGCPLAEWDMTRAMWIVFGFVALGVGAFGIILPVLPTTPFVILAAFAFAKGSPTLEGRLRAHPVFGPMIRDWTAKGAIAPRYKAIALTMMVGAFAASLVFGFSPTILVVQAVCILAASAYILTRPNS